MKSPATTQGARRTEDGGRRPSLRLPPSAFRLLAPALLLLSTLNSQLSTALGAQDPVLVNRSTRAVSETDLIFTGTNSRFVGIKKTGTGTLTITGTDGGTLTIGGITLGTATLLNSGTLLGTTTNSGTISGGTVTNALITSSTANALLLTGTPTIQDSGTNYAMLSTSGTGSLVGLVLATKGNAAITVQRPDGTTVGGIGRGDRAIDFQYLRTASTQTASGVGSFLVGNYSTASGAGAIAMGQDCVASGQNSVAMGENAIASANSTVGLDGVATAIGAISLGGSSGGVQSYSVFGYAGLHYSQALGVGANTTSVGEYAVSPSIPLYIKGEIQTGKKFLLGVTEDGSSASLTDVDGNETGCPLTNRTTWKFVARVIARRQTAEGDVAIYQFDGAIDRGANAASTRFLGTPTKTVVHEDSAGWDVSVSANTTTGALDITVSTGEVKSVYWMAEIDYFQNISSQ